MKDEKLVKEGRKNIALIVVGLLLLTALCYGGLMYSKNVSTKKFLTECKAIFKSAVSEDKKNHKQYYDSNKNWLKTYDGTCTYFLELDEENNIIYYFIYDNDHLIESTSIGIYNIDDIMENKIISVTNDNRSELNEKFNLLLKEGNKKEDKEPDNKTDDKEIKEDDIDNNEDKINNENNDDNPTDNSLTYTIETSQYEKGGRKGYTGEMVDGKFIITISMGQRSNGGYSLEVLSIDINSEDVIITIKEHTPDKDGKYTQAITYPKAKVIFNREPASYKVVKEDGTDYNG